MSRPIWNTGMTIAQNVSLALFGAGRRSVGLRLDAAERIVASASDDRGSVGYYPSPRHPSPHSVAVVQDGDVLGHHVMGLLLGNVTSHAR